LVNKLGQYVIPTNIVIKLDNDPVNIISKGHDFKQLLPIKTYSINKTHVLLHTKYIPRVLCNTMGFHHF